MNKPKDKQGEQDESVAELVKESNLTQEQLFEKSSLGTVKVKIDCKIG